MWQPTSRRSFSFDLKGSSRPDSWRNRDNFQTSQNDLAESAHICNSSINPCLSSSVAPCNAIKEKNVSSAMFLAILIIKQWVVDDCLVFFCHDECWSVLYPCPCVSYPNLSVCLEWQQFQLRVFCLAGDGFRMV